MGNSNQWGNHALGTTGEAVKGAGLLMPEMLMPRMLMPIQDADARPGC